MNKKLNKSAFYVFYDLIKLANANLHENILLDRELRYRGRTLLLSAYVYMGLAILTSPLIFILEVTAIDRVILICIWFFQFFSFGIVVYLLQVQGFYKIAAHLMIFSMVSLVLLGILISGGPSQSPFIKVVLFLPVIIFYLLGLKNGMTWTIFIVIALSALFFLEAQAYIFKNTIPESIRLEISGLIYMIGFISISSMILIYENTFIGLQAQQQKSQAQTRYLATHDKLTGIANRTFFYSELEASFEKIQGNKTPKQLALLYMDLVGFKEVNDTHGHHVGDVVLQRIAKNLEAGVRGTDLVARHGGDEFVILLRMVKDSESIEFIANKIAEIVSQKIETSGLSIQVFPSMGIAFYPEHANDLVALEKLADKAMYHAKSEKRDWKIHEGASSSMRNF